MSFLNLDEERERKEKESQLAQQPQIEAEKEAKGDTISLLVICGIISLVIGYNTDPDRLFTPAKFGAMIGTVFGLLLLSAIPAFISNKIFAKWKLAFIIAFVFLASAQLVVYFYEKKERPRYYQR